jgi:hypothetical protein
MANYALELAAERLLKEVTNLFNGTTEVKFVHNGNTGRLDKVYIQRTDRA